MFLTLLADSPQFSVSVGKSLGGDRELRELIFFEANASSRTCLEIDEHYVFCDDHQAYRYHPKNPGDDPIRERLSMRVAVQNIPETAAWAAELVGRQSGGSKDPIGLIQYFRPGQTSDDARLQSTLFLTECEYTHLKELFRHRSDPVEILLRFKVPLIEEEKLPNLSYGSLDSLRWLTTREPESAAIGIEAVEFRTRSGVRVSTELSQSPTPELLTSRTLNVLSTVQSDLSKLASQIKTPTTEVIGYKAAFFAAVTAWILSSVLK